MEGMFWIEPPAAMMRFFMLSSQRPKLIRSRRSQGHTTWKSPDSTRRAYSMDVYGSKHSFHPRICEVEAVGIGATRRELRTPCSLIWARRVVQSQRSVGTRPQRSNWSLPCDMGEPSYVSYLPRSRAISHDASRAAW